MLSDRTLLPSYLYDAKTLPFGIGLLAKPHVILRAICGPSFRCTPWSGCPRTNGKPGTRTPNGFTHYLLSKQAPHPAGYFPVLFSRHPRIRTGNLPLRRGMLYPVGLDGVVEGNIRLPSKIVKGFPLPLGESSLVPLSRFSEVLNRRVRQSKARTGFEPASKRFAGVSLSSRAPGHYFN